jgi:hypothetical protein
VYPYILRGVANFFLDIGMGKGDNSEYGVEESRGRATSYYATSYYKMDDLILLNMSGRPLTSTTSYYQMDDLIF